MMTADKNDAAQKMHWLFANVPNTRLAGSPSREQQHSLLERTKVTCLVQQDMGSAVRAYFTAIDCRAGVAAFGIPGLGDGTLAIFVMAGFVPAIHISSSSVP
jgi:hypothetical protein